MKQSMGIFDILGVSVEVFKANWPILLGLALVSPGIQLTQGLLVENGLAGPSILLGYASFAWLLVLGAILAQRTKSYFERSGNRFAQDLSEVVGLAPQLLSSGFLATLFVGLGCAALLIPGIYLYFNYCLFIAVVIWDRAGGMEALRRSRALVHVDRNLVANTLIGLPILAALLIYLPSNFAVGMLSAGNAALSSTLQLGLNAVLGYLGMVLQITPVVLYVHLRERQTEVADNEVGFNRY
jgi:hypothetical protein